MADINKLSTLMGTGVEIPLDVQNGLLAQHSAQPVQQVAAFVPDVTPTFDGMG